MIIFRPCASEAGAVLSNIMEYECLMNEFACPVCLSPALVYPKVLEDDQPVVCAECGSFVSTFGELKRRLEHAPSSSPTDVGVSGC
jgi:hypothetical protein